MSVTHVEALIAVCVAKGAWADLRDLHEADRVVTADFIRRVLMAMPLARSDHDAITHHQPEYAAFRPIADFAPVPVAAAGLRLRGAIIAGLVDLSNCAGHGGASLPALALEACRLLGRTDVGEDELQDDRALICLDLSRAVIASVSLKDSAFTHVAMLNARIDGAIDISGVGPLAGWTERARSDRMTAFRAAMVAAAGKMRNGSGDTRFADLLPAERPLDDVEARRPMVMRRHDYCWLDLSGSSIQGSILARRARLRAPLRDRKGITDPQRSPRFALRLEGVVVAGTLDARGGSVFDGGLSLYLAEIRDEVWLGGGQLRKEQGVALDAQGARLGGMFAIAAPPLSIVGTVFLNSVRISGHLNLQAADIDGDGGASLMVEAASIGGDMTLGARVAARGPVGLSGTSIGGTLDLRGAVISGLVERDRAGGITIDYCNAIHGRNLSIASDAFLSDGFIAHGCVWLSGARIGDDLDLRGSTLAGTIPKQYQDLPEDSQDGPPPPPARGALALSCSDMSVGGCLRIGSRRPVERLFCGQGGVNLQRVTVAKDLDIINSTITPLPSDTPDADVLDLGWTAVSGTLILSSNAFNGAINLEHATTNIICDDEGGYGGASHLKLNGFRYESFYEPEDDAEKTASPHLVDVRKAWLKRMPDYRPQPYANLARVLIRHGRPDEARDILVEKHECERKERVRGLSWRLFVQHPIRAAQMALPWVPSSGFGVMFGYGLKPSRAIRTLLCAFVIGWAFFYFANDRGAMVVDQQPIAGYVEGDEMGAFRAAKGDIATGVRCRDNIRSALYALDVFIPLVDLRQESKCEMGKAIDATLFEGFGLSRWRVLGEVEIYRYFKALYALSGWLLISLSILTFSGVLQRRDAEE